MFQAITIGSIQTTVQANGGSYASADSATGDMTTALSSTPLDGATYISSSIVGYNFNGNQDETNYLPLILGLTIPFSLLCML